MPVKSAHELKAPIKDDLPIEDVLELRARELLAQMRALANMRGGREMALAITNLEQSILWLLVANGDVE